MKKVLTGLDMIISSEEERQKITGNIAYLGNQASVSGELENGLDILISLYGEKLVKAFGPQHGFAISDQDNMIETPHEVHPIHGIPVYSLYSETRRPTEMMLEGVNTIVIDLQDVGTRVYTYIWSLFHILESVQDKDIRIVVLDRPNPVGGLLVQGNLPDEDFFSFVCRSKIPVRHGMTIGEMALWFKKMHFPGAQIELVKMNGWERAMYWKDTGLAWVNPSPNLPTPEGCIDYPGTVLFEGTNISEGRGTTRSLEIIGHPGIDPYLLKPELDLLLKSMGLDGYFLRPVFFEPAFNKFSGRSCGGFQIHPTRPEVFNPWKLGQMIISFLYNRLGPDNFWNDRPYEYEYTGLATDWINGTGRIRELIEDNLLKDNLTELEQTGMEEFLSERNECLLYSK